MPADRGGQALTKLEWQYVRAYIRWRLDKRSSRPWGSNEGVTARRRQELDSQADWALGPDAGSAAPARR